MVVLLSSTEDYFQRTKRPFLKARDTKPSMWHILKPFRRIFSLKILPQGWMKKLFVLYMYCMAIIMLHSLSIFRGWTRKEDWPTKRLMSFRFVRFAGLGYYSLAAALIFHKCSIHKKQTPSSYNTSAFVISAVCLALLALSHVLFQSTLLFYLLHLRTTIYMYRVPFSISHVVNGIVQRTVTVPLIIGNWFVQLSAIIVMVHTQITFLRKMRWFHKNIDNLGEAAVDIRRARGIAWKELIYLFQRKLSLCNDIRSALQTEYSFVLFMWISQTVLAFIMSIGLLMTNKRSDLFVRVLLFEQAIFFMVQLVMVVYPSDIAEKKRKFCEEMLIETIVNNTQYWREEGKQLFRLKQVVEKTLFSLNALGLFQVDRIILFTVFGACITYGLIIHQLLSV